MSLYDDIYAEAIKTICHEDADFLAANLSTMHPGDVLRLFDVIDNYEPSEGEQGLILIPDGYNEA
jgi:hypothetical protein